MPSAKVRSAGFLRAMLSRNVSLSMQSSASPRSSTEARTPSPLCSRYLQQNPRKNPLPGQFVRPSSRFNPFAMYNMRIANAGGRFAISKQLANAGEFQSAPGGRLTHEERFQSLPRGGACVRDSIHRGAAARHVVEDVSRKRVHGGTGQSRRTGLYREVFHVSWRQPGRGGDGAGSGGRELPKGLGKPAAADARQSNQDHHAADRAQLAVGATSLPICSASS